MEMGPFSGWSSVSLIGRGSKREDGEQGVLLNPGRKGPEASVLSPSHAGLCPKLVPRQEGRRCPGQWSSCLQESRTEGSLTLFSGDFYSVSLTCEGKTQEP